jgi:hypothetical protein
MRDGRCPHCSETARLAGKPKDFLPSLNTIDDIPTLERYAMTATHEAPTMLPGPVNGWTGQYKACRGCGNRSKMEIEDGYCADCFQEEFGALGLKMAEARKDAAPAGLSRQRPEPPAVEALPEHAPVVPAAPAPAARWHPEYDACLNCETTERQHAGRGLCTRCRPLSLKPGYTGRIAPAKVRVGGRWVAQGAEAEAQAAPPARDDTSVAAVEATVARHMAALAAPLPGPLPGPEPDRDSVAVVEPVPLATPAGPTLPAVAAGSPAPAPWQPGGHIVYFSLVTGAFRAAPSSATEPLVRVGGPQATEGHASALAECLNGCVLPSDRPRLALALLALRGERCR